MQIEDTSWRRSPVDQERRRAKKVYYVGSPTRTSIIEAKYLFRMAEWENDTRERLSLLFAIRTSFARSTRRGEESSWPGIDCPSCLFISLNASSSSREWGSIVSWRGSNIRFNFPRGTRIRETRYHFIIFGTLTFQTLSIFFHHCLLNPFFSFLFVIILCWIIFNLLQDRNIQFTHRSFNLLHLLFFALLSIHFISESMYYSLIRYIYLVLYNTFSYSLFLYNTLWWSF